MRYFLMWLWVRLNNGLFALGLARHRIGIGRVIVTEVYYDGQRQQ